MPAEYLNFFGIYDLLMSNLVYCLLLLYHETTKTYSYPGTAPLPGFSH